MFALVHSVTARASCDRLTSFVIADGDDELDLETRIATLCFACARLLSAAVRKALVDSDVIAMID